MSVSDTNFALTDLKERLTNLLNMAVRKYSSRKLSSVFRVKPSTIWQWSAGERENPLTQTIEFLEWLRHRDPQLYAEVARVFGEFLKGDALKVLQIKEFAWKLFRYYMDDHRYDMKEKAELEREFKELVKEE